MSLSIHAMTSCDIPLGMRLKDQAGWNQLPADWRRFLDLEPEGCFVALWEDQPVATTTTCTFGHVGWIAMVLVDESYRHRGIASALVKRAIDYLETRSVTSVRLDATHFGRPVYERIGFAAQGEFVRMQGIAQGNRPVTQGDQAAPGDLESLAALDHEATGTDRWRLLERLVIENPASVRVIRAGGQIEGYTMLRPGANATQIGPAVARSAETGVALADWALGQREGQPVFTDVPLDNPAAILWARESGLEEQRRFTRMVRGQLVEEDTVLLWASSGPEKG